MPTPIEQENATVPTLVYLAIGAVAVCGCLFFFTRARSRD
jgi:hypothetical protein